MARAIRSHHTGPGGDAGRIVTGRTIGDIAREAGVSTATVDRALNGRRGVSAANRQRVLAAATRLGYLPLAGMVPLPARPVALEFLLPLHGASFMRALGAGIEAAAAAHPLVASCRVRALSGIAPEALEAALDRVALDTAGVGLVAVDHPRCRAAVARLTEAGVRVATLLSDIEGTPRAVYVGVDNRAAGRTAAHVMGLVAGPRGGAVALMLGSAAFRGHEERAAGFAAVLAGFPSLRILEPVETGEDANRARRALGALLRRRDDLAGVYCVGGGRAGVAEALREAAGGGRRPFAVLHDLTDGARGWLAEGLIDMVIDQNARAIGEQAVLRLLGAIASGAAPPPSRPMEARLILRENIPPP